MDQRVAVVGGLDLLVGRWDDHSHRMADVKKQSWLGLDYVSPDGGGGPDLQEREYEDHCDRNRSPRQPWHDVQAMVAGAAAHDAARVFVRRWNHHRKSDKPRLVLEIMREAGANGDDIDSEYTGGVVRRRSSIASPALALLALHRADSAGTDRTSDTVTKSGLQSPANPPRRIATDGNMRRSDSEQLANQAAGTHRARVSSVRGAINPRPREQEEGEEDPSELGRHS